MLEFMRNLLQNNPFLTLKEIRDEFHNKFSDLKLKKIGFCKLIKQAGFKKKKIHLEESQERKEKKIQENKLFAEKYL